LEQEGNDMLREFTVDTQKFTIKTCFDRPCLDEAKIRFESREQAQAFFAHALQFGGNSKHIRQIAKNVATSYCPTKNAPKPTDNDFLQNMISDIASGKLSILLKNVGLKRSSAAPDISGKDVPFNFDFLQLARNYSNDIKAACRRLVNREYHILEKVFHFEEGADSTLRIVDTGSVKVHETGWRSWDNPFEIAVLGAFKAAVVFHAGEFLNLSKSIVAAALIGSQTEFVSGQYFVTGKSVNCKNWYGSYAIRFNLRTFSLEIPWIKFNKCGPVERMLVELKRKDRLVMLDKSLYNHPEMLISPFIPMEQFLSDYKKGFAPPEHDVNKPIRL
jgi:hypothetical protein